MWLPARVTPEIAVAGVPFPRPARCTDSNHLPSFF